MERTVILQEFKTILQNYVEDESILENLHEGADLIDDLKINSAHLIDVVLEAETKFKIDIDNAAIEKINTVKSCVDIITTKLANAVSR